MRKRMTLISCIVLTLLAFSGCEKAEYHEPKRIILVSSTETDPAVTSTVAATTSSKASQQAATPQDKDKSREVYYTKTGKKYHFKADCGGNEMLTCTLEEAIDKGLEPCKKCTE